MPSPLALSPDDREVAFVLSQADPVTNSYCRRLMVAAVEPDASPRTLDEGGDLILLKDDYRGLLVTVGFPAFVTPAWSPDGKWIAYQRRDRGVTQLWRVAARSEEHTSELQSLMRISYAVFCLKKKTPTNNRR